MLLFLPAVSAMHEKLDGEERAPSSGLPSGSVPFSSEPPFFNLLDEDPEPVSLLDRQEVSKDASLTALGGELISICSSVSIKDRNTLEDSFVSSFVDTTNAYRSRERATGKGSRAKICFFT